MNKNNTYFERIIRRAIMEQAEIPPPAGSSQETIAPPTEVKYRLVGADGKTDMVNEYTANELKSKNLNADSWVYNKEALGGWKKIKDVPELSSVISASPDKQATPPSGDVTMDAAPAGASKSFFDYCPKAKAGRDTQTASYTKMQQRDIDDSISKGGGLEEVNAIAEKYFKAQGDFDKGTFLGACMEELKGVLKGNNEEILKFQGPYNKWMATDGKELGKKALKAGGNILFNLANKALQAKGLGALKFENTLKKNTKNSLMEIYNRKNKRR